MKDSGKESCSEGRGKVKQLSLVLKRIALFIHWMCGRREINENRGGESAFRKQIACFFVFLELIEH